MFDECARILRSFGGKARRSLVYRRAQRDWKLLVKLYRAFAQPPDWITCAHIGTTYKIYVCMCKDICTYISFTYEYMWMCVCVYNLCVLEGWLCVCVVPVFAQWPCSKVTPIKPTNGRYLRWPLTGLRQVVRCELYRINCLKEESVKYLYKVSTEISWQFVRKLTMKIIVEFCINNVMNIWQLIFKWAFTVSTF